MSFDTYKSVELENKMCENLDDWQISIYEKIKEQHYMIGIPIEVLQELYKNKINQLIEILKAVDIELKKEELEGIN